MFMQLVRENDDGESTIGKMFVNGTFECYTLEDTFNEPKVWGKTRIPDGTYEIKLRDVGGMTKKYASRYANHRGMLWLQNVDNFEWVYIHTGNNEEHTDGCILVGDILKSEGKQAIYKSRPAYQRLYKQVLEAMDNGEDITIEVVTG